MKASELHNQTPAELRVLLREQEQILAEMRFTHTLSPVENPARMREIRKTIARIHTVLSSQPQPETK